MLKSELLEREAEARRLQLAETFEELRARATPGHMLDQLVDYASGSGGVDFFRNLRDQTVANPLALGLVGAGLAWLMMSSRDGRRGYDPYAAFDPDASVSRGRTRGYGYFERAGNAMSGARHFVSGAAAGVRHGVAGAAHMASDLASDMASDAAGSITSTARSARDAAFGTVSSVGETVSSVGGEARSRAGDATAAIGGAAQALYGGVSHTAGRTASGVRAMASGTASTGRDVFDFARDQPLVLAGLGLAFGAAMGAAFRSTEMERQLMGEASDDLRERTQAFAAEGYEKSRSVAGAVYDEFQQRASPGSGQESSQSAAGRTHTSIVPLEEEITEIEEKIRPDFPERIGHRGERS
jgi:hypothetical protein